MSDDATEGTEGEGNEGSADTEILDNNADGSEGSEGSENSGGDNTDGDKTGDDTGKADGEGEGKETGAPAEYKFEAPEGVEYDASVIKTFSEAAKDLDLTQEQAGTLLEKLAPAVAESQQAQVEQLRNDWEDQTKNDPEIGGDKLDENLSIAKKGLEAVGTESLTKLLEDSGLGNHPDVVKLFHKIGGMVKEDGFISSDGSDNKDTGPLTDTKAASKFYDNPTSNQN